MDKRKEEFLARLRETFRSEAGEHLEVIATGALAIEGSGGAERASMIEKVFREVHSLKGAARSVGYRDVEALCQELESVFAAMKRGNLSASEALLDAIRPSLGVLRAMCEFPDAPPSQTSLEREKEAHATLGRILSGEIPDSSTASRDVRNSAPIKDENLARPAADGVLAPPLQAMDSANARDETVRISTQKLGAVLLETEELVGAKIAARGRAGELRALAHDIAEWNKRPALKAARRGRGQARELAFAELLESEVLHSKSLEYSLRNLAAAANQDSLFLGSVADRLLENTKELLLLPCSHLLDGLRMILHDLSRELGKEAELISLGEDIEIDRRVLDGLKDPLVHMLRNCLDHGIEKPEDREKTGKPRRGTITVAARAMEGKRVELTVADDGAGIDRTKVAHAAERMGLIAENEVAGLAEVAAFGLIFDSGLTTSPIITDLSGRGLGLAIAREKIEKLGGTISVASTLGVGTSFRILVPLSLATFRGVIVGLANRSFVIPTANVERAIRVDNADIKTIENRPTIASEGRALSLVRLRDILGLEIPEKEASRRLRPALVLRSGDRHAAFLVDEVLGEEEVMVKSLGPQLKRVRNIAGAVISNGGTIIPILDATDLVESASSAAAKTGRPAEHFDAIERRPRILVAEDSITARTLVKTILEGAGYDVAASVDGLDALTKLKMEAFDLLVSDVDMPRMNGFELTSKIRADKKLG
ncbi:MAG TPA: chemotaxis protein CheW, partial [Rectinemataceae bacterium]|nr:chemotaxis protein CheW [Rectinemataceae bacterium]